MCVYVCLVCWFKFPNWENLIEVLDLESREYENLLELSTKKTPVIVAGELEQLAKITDEEQTVQAPVLKGQEAAE